MPQLLFFADQTDLSKDMLLTSFRTAQQQYFAATDKLISYQQELANKVAKEAKTDASRSNILLIILTAAACRVSGFFAFLIIRSITGPVDKTVKLAESMVMGDLTVKLEVNQQDEIGKMANSMNTMVTKLRTMFGEVVVDDISKNIAEINQEANQVRTGSSQVQTSAQGLSDLSDQLENLMKQFRV